MQNGNGTSPLNSAKRRGILNFVYLGGNGPLFGLFIKNIFLSIITLGIYSFWGRVAISKYIYSSIELNDQPFGYHATGKERFLGFLKGVAILLVGLAVISGIGFIVKMLAGATIASAVQGILFVIAIFAIQPLLIFGSHRFRLSRTSYSNIRFRFSTDLKEFVLFYFKNIFLVVITFGIYFPWFFNNLLNRLIANSYLGNVKFNYNGNGKELFFIYLKGFLLTIITFGIYSFWFNANVIRYIFNHSDFNTNPMRCKITGGDLFVLQLFSFFVIVFTLGLGFPIAVNKAIHIFFESLDLEIDPAELENLKNISDAGASALSDGISEAAEAIDAISGIV